MRSRKQFGALGLLAAGVVAMLAITPSAFSWTVTMTADTNHKRTHTWTVDKSVSTPLITLGPGETGTATYSVTVSTTGFTDSDWAVSGAVAYSSDPDITIGGVEAFATPPNMFVPETPGTIGCSPSPFPVTLVTGLACDYEIALANANAGDAHAIASVTASPNGPGSRHVGAPFDFSTATVEHANQCVDVTDSLAGSLGTVCVGDSPKTFTYTRSYGPFADCGEHVVPNTATVSSGGTVLASDSASVTVRVERCAQPAVFLVIDEDGIDNDDRYWLNSASAFTPSTIKKWSTTEVNDDVPKLGQRMQLRWFEANVGQTYWLWTGQVGDEGWFAPKAIPASWAGAGPTSDGLRNFLGNPVGSGLGTGSNPESLLDRIPYVAPLRAEGLHMLIGRTVCAVVYDSNISINYGPLNGSLKGENLGIVAFDVSNVVYLPGFSSSTLPRVQVTIRNANDVCAGPQTLFNNAPEPKASSEPMDIRPNHAGDNSGYVTPTPVR